MESDPLISGGHFEIFLGEGAKPSSNAKFVPKCILELKNFCHVLQVGNY